MTGELSYKAHASAEISDGAEVGPGTVIWQNCIVMSGARVGRNCKLGHNVFVEDGAIVGERVTIKDNVCIYSGVQIDDDVFIGPNAVFTNVLTPRAAISRKGEFTLTIIRSGATIGANATIICGNTVADYAMIGAGAVITSDVAAHALMVGNPARRLGWVSRSGTRLDDSFICPETGESYSLTEFGLELNS